MARQQHDREDLLAEATALVERVELAIEGFTEPVVIGVRRDGCLSLYFGADPAFHFNTRHELRRAFVADRLLKAEAGRLVSLTRHRADGEVQLVRQEWSPEAQAEFLVGIQKRITQLRTALEQGKCRALRQMPETIQPLERALVWLTPLVGEVHVAASPHAI